MTGCLDAGTRRAPGEVNKQFADQRQREDAPTKADVRNHPFGWWDLLLFALPMTTIVFAIFWEAE